MDLQLLNKGLNFSRRKKKWLIAFALLGVSSYGGYKVYHLPSVERKRKRIFKLLGALISISEMVSDSADTIGVVSKDLKHFLQSDSDQIPNSLKQLSKIAMSEQLSQSLIRVSEAMTVGILRGYCSETRNEIEEGLNSSFSNWVMDNLMSTTRTRFVSVVVGSFAQNLVLAFYSNGESDECSNGDGLVCASNVFGLDSSALPEWLNVVSSAKCKLLIADCIQKFVSTAVSVCLDKTMDVNIYDEMFSGITNPKYQTKVSDFLVSICDGVVETLVKTSHQVLTKSKSNPDLSSSYSASIVDQSTSPSGIREEFPEQVSPSTELKVKSMGNGIQNNGWVSTVSSTLTIPSNRRFLLDVTGRVTYETVTSLV